MRALAAGESPVTLYPPRALPEVGGRTHEGRKLFHLRENFADKRQKHSKLILAACLVWSGRPPAALPLILFESHYSRSSFIPAAAAASDTSVRLRH